MKYILTEDEIKNINIVGDLNPDIDRDIVFNKCIFFLKYYKREIVIEKIMGAVIGVLIAFIIGYLLLHFCFGIKSIYEYLKYYVFTAQMVAIIILMILSSGISSIEGLDDDIMYGVKKRLTDAGIIQKKE